MTPTMYPMFIRGEWTPAESGETFEIIDPATEEVIGLVPRGRTADIDRAVAGAREAFDGPWGRVSAKDRGRLLNTLARALEEDAEEFAQLETRDQGKPIAQARRDVMSSARYFEYFGGAADKFMGDTMPVDPNYVRLTLREPLGVTAHIVPWNFPLSLLCRSLAPALAAGNTAVAKPAEQTPLTALKLAELMQALDFPAGVFNVVTGFGEEAGAALSAHPEIDSVSFTGSVEVGRLIMKAAAEHIKPVVLELGGKSPHIIFADTDLDLAVTEVAKGIYTNSGQVCSAGSRLIVEASIKTELLERLRTHTAQLRLGPGVSGPDLGPLNSREHYDRVMGYIEAGQQEGARLSAGGGRPADLPRGYFVEPTIFDEVQPDMRIAQEEIFGPVLSVLSFEDEAEALQIANGVKYGLVAGVFTHDINRALRLAKAIRAGVVYVNEYFSAGMELPFGGYKQSGFGREQGVEALEHYSQVKALSIRIR